MKISNISLDGFQALDSHCPDSEQLHVPTGNLVRTLNLFTIPTQGRALQFTLYHNSRSITEAGDVGIGWRHNVQAQLSRADDTATELTFLDETGRARNFQKVDERWVLQDDSIFEQYQLTRERNGRWILLQESNFKTLEFEDQIGSTPLVSRLVRIKDSSENTVEYDFDGSQQLTSIREPLSDRAISLSWTSGRITSVSDPQENTFSLGYTDDLLTSLEMPGGCLVEFAYDSEQRIESRSDVTSASTLYTYDEDGRLIRIDGPEENGDRPFATWSYSEEPVQEIANLSPSSDPTGEYIQLNQVLFITARGNAWEYRFLANGMLWREISPLGHHRRYFYDDKQNLLYSSEGFARPNMDDSSDQELFGPRDNINNMFRSSVWDERGNLLQSIDANGLVTAFTYGQGSQPLSVYAGQAHYGLGGDWPAHFGQDGILLCGQADNGENGGTLPSYIAEVARGVEIDVEADGFGDSRSIILSNQVLAGPRRRIGYWTSEESSMTFSLELEEARAFNLSLYTHSLDQLEGSSNTLDYPECFGRELNFRVTDQAGVQEFLVTQNAGGVWVTFPVVGDESHPVTVTVSCPLSEHRPTVGALAFDPYEDRRQRMSYGASGYLSKTIEPTSDPDEEVATEYRYNEDGTVSEVSQVLRMSGAVVDQRTTRMFYEDAARNLTRVEDPQNQDVAPTLMEYDLNSNMVHLTDPDGREMFFSYDYRGRVLEVKNGLNQIHTMRYDGRGLLYETEDPRSCLTRFEYTPSRQVAKVTDAKNLETMYSYYPDGLLQSIEDPHHRVTQFIYDEEDRLIEVVSPTWEVVQPDFDRSYAESKVRLAYDVWSRVTAMTSPNGNQDELAHTNLVGALNLLRNPELRVENGLRNQVPVGWQEDTASGFLSDSSWEESGKLPLSLSSEDDNRAWVQRRPGGTPGGRYLMKGTGNSDLAGYLRLYAVVRQFDGGLTDLGEGVELAGGNTPAELTARVDLPGDAQTSRRMPALHQFRAVIARSESGAAEATVEQMAVLALSQLNHYDGEYSAGSLGADGAQMRVIRDRFGRPRRMIDPIYRSVSFLYDARDRIVQVTDSQGLSLKYEWDFLGNLTKFIDSREMETTFAYDLLGRVTSITQPGGTQSEQFSYTPAGDLASYTNCRSQAREFVYDEAHRLSQIHYLVGAETEVVQMYYGSSGNLDEMIERNGDRTRFNYDELDRLQSQTRISASGGGPSWALSQDLDGNGMRQSLKSRNAFYGQARFGTDTYGDDSETEIFAADYDENSRMRWLKDSANNETTFGYDIDGRLAEVNHPVEGLQTRYRYDLVGKLLESRLTDGEDELWHLGYSYNLAGERLRQTSHWDGGGNCFEYQLDASGRLVRETINRWVVDNAEDWSSGSNQQTAFALDGKLRLLAREDDLQSTLLDAQRWELVLSEQVATAVRVAARSGGLEFATSVGATQRNGRSGPQGWALDASNAHTDYPHDFNTQALDTVGDFDGRMLLRHRLPLQGAFDIQVALSSFDLVECAIGLGVSRDRFQTGAGEYRFPTDFGGAIDVNGCDIVIKEDGGLLAQFNNSAKGDVTPTKLRLKRFLDGSDWKLQAYYHDGEDWVTDVAWVGVVDDQELYAYLHLSGKVGYLKWSDFLDTVGDPYPTSGVYESRTYDAGRSVDWTRISWNEVCPSGTGVSFQVAISEDADGPWSYGSALTTAAGTTITSTTGRYARFKVSMSSDGSDTPVINEVQVSHDGTSGSRVTRWIYDDAGNITSQVRVTDAGTETGSRSYNDLNQMTTSSGGWTYQYDLDGNLTGKNNGTAEDCEKWEYSWSDNSRLVQVKKGVYDATPTLVNEFSVDYSYDEMGRMLRRDDGTDVTDYFYDGWDIWKEVTGESVTEYLVPGLGIQSFVRNGELHTLHTDGLGSIRTMTDSEGSVVARMEMCAWGETLPGSTESVTGGLSMDFVGGLGVRRDPLTGLYYMRYRWYDPSSQRFISRDPIGHAGGQNLYSYAGNSPAQTADPSGLIEIYPEPATTGNEDWENNGTLLGAKWDDKTQCPTTYAHQSGVDFLAIGWGKSQAEAYMTFGPMPKLPIPIGAARPTKVVLDNNALVKIMFRGRTELLRGRIPLVPPIVASEFLRGPGRTTEQLVGFLRSTGGRFAQHGSQKVAMELQASVRAVGPASRWVRGKYIPGPKLKFKDAMVWASAKRERCVLITGDRKFANKMESVGYMLFEFFVPGGK